MDPTNETGLSKVTGTTPTRRRSNPITNNNLFVINIQSHAQIPPASSQTSRPCSPPDYHSKTSIGNPQLGPPVPSNR